MIKVVLFDFDGVIVDTFAFCHRIANMRAPVDEEDYRSRFEGNINDALKNIRPSSTPEFRFFDHYTPELMACCAHPDVIRAIKELAETRVLIIISSTISQPIADFLEQNGIKNAFREILGNDVEKSKVKKIKDALERYGIAPSEAVFVTDTLGDIKEADACGVQSIAVTWGYHPRETLERGHPYRIIESPDEIIPAIRSLE